MYICSCSDLEKKPNDTDFADAIRHSAFPQRPELKKIKKPTAKWVLLKAVRRPGGPEAHTVLLSSGKSTRMLRFASGLGAQMKDGEFEFVYHFNNHFNPFRSFLSLHVAK